MRNAVALIIAALVALTIRSTRGSWTSPARRPNACSDSASITTEPATPTKGSLFRVRVTGAAAASELLGRVSGEALHFETNGGASESLAPIPIDAPDSLLIVIRCTSGEATDS